MNDDVLIVGKLDDKALLDSIDNLVNEVANKSSLMANKFQESINLMNGAMKDFAINQKVSVDLMKQAWREMSSSFDAMVAAQSGATGSGGAGGGSGRPSYADNTVGALEQEIALETKRRKEMELGSAELANQNKLLDERKNKLKEETTSYANKERARLKEDLAWAKNLPQNELSQIEKKLREISLVKDRMEQSGLFKLSEIRAVGTAIDNLKHKLDSMRSKSPKTLRDVLGMDENSLDAITKKMAALKQVTTTDSSQVKAIGDEYQRLTKLRTEYLGKSIEQTAKLTRNNNYLAQSFGYIRNRIVYAFTIGAVVNFTKQLYAVRGEYELLERSLGVLLDDLGRGSKVFRELNAMSLKSPFTLIDLAGAAKQLAAYNFQADELVDTTRRLADISAALGVPIERIVYNLGQIRAQNVLNARDARDFANAGLPIVSMLADMYTEQKRFGDETVTTAQVYDMMSKKMVSYADVMQVINKVTDEGGKFFDFQAKQADTLKVQLANLTLAYNNMLDSIGKENQGALSGSIKMLRALLLNWRQVYRVLMTLITTYGAYRAAVAFVGVEHKRTFGLRMLVSLRQWVNGIRNATTAMNALNAAFKSNAIGLIVSAIAALISYFWLFNNSADELNQKLKEINDDFTSLRSNVTDIFVDALKTDNINTQIDKLKELVDFAHSELGITIPVNVQEIDAQNVAQKLRETKQQIDEYLDFAQAFTIEAAKNKPLGENFIEFGDVTQTTFTGIYNSINTVIEGLQSLADQGQATGRELEILEELISGRRDGESKLEYLQRLIFKYQELGLVFRRIYRVDDIDRLEEQQEQQEQALARLGVKNKEVFTGLTEDVSIFYDSSLTAARELENTINSLARRIDINGIPEDQRTLKLSAAINEEAAKNNWSDFAKQFARQVANEKFGTKIVISDESKNTAETELKDWQKRLQDWANANGITLGITLNMSTTEVDAAEQALQNVKKAQELLAVQQRKLGVGMATQADVEKASADLKNALQVAKMAGSDLSSLNKNKGGTKKDQVLEAIKEEISLVKKLQSEYDKLTKAGMANADAIAFMQDAYGSTIRLLNKDLKAFKLPELDLSQIAGRDPNKILAFFNNLRNILESSGLSNLERMKAVEGVIEEFQVSAKTYNLDKITKGLNNELSKLKEDYELAIELQADPEMNDMLFDLFNIDPSVLPSSIDEYAARVTDALNKAFEARKENLRLPTINLTRDDIAAYQQMVYDNTLSETSFNDIKKAYDAIRSLREKDARDVYKKTQQLEYDLSDVYGKIAIEERKLANLQERLSQEVNDERRRLLELQVHEQQETIARLGDDVLQMLPTYKNLFNSIVEHSDVATRQIAEQWKNALNMAKQNSDGTFTISDPLTGQTATISRTQYGKEVDKVDKELRKGISSFKKIKEAFELGEDNTIDWSKGIELLGDEATKLADGLRTVAEIIGTLGGEDAEGTVETLNDIATTMEGVSEAASGVARIAAGDVIGGTVGVIKGAWKAINTWLDNSDKRIDRKIRDSKRYVKQLEKTYAELEYQVEKAMGTAEISARRAAMANKQLQLAELERQLALEKSRKKKKQDKDAIIELEMQIGSLKRELLDLKDDVVNNLLGSDVKAAAEQFVDAWVGAWKEGKSTMKDIKNEMNEMMLELVKKAATSALVAEIIKPMYDAIEKYTSVDSEGGMAMTTGEIRGLAEMTKTMSEEIDKTLRAYYGNLEMLGAVSKQNNLSSLQQGIQSITEDTAGALEAYMNGVSQQVYLHSDLLTEIRDSLVSFNIDVQVATMGQMLLQLQQSYQVQQSIESILQGVLTPAGRAFMVELAS